jgi:hypothetical protein
MSDFRLHSPHCPDGRPPDGIRRLDVATDYYAFPVWTRFTVRGREVYGCVLPKALGISAELAADLQAWADWHDAHRSERSDRSAGPAARWHADGRTLAQRLAAETGDAVVYRWPAEGYDPGCPSCADRRPP